MDITINSRRYGELTFSRPGGYYVYCDMGERRNHGTLGKQICRGGRLSGSTIAYGGDDPKELRRIAHNWLRARARKDD